MARVEITGPSSVAPGETASFTATAHFTDGSTRDVTSEAAWMSQFPAVLSIVGPGLVRGQERGETYLSASLGQPRGAATREIMVHPAGTFRVDGMVSEAGHPNTPIEAARIEVVEGSAAGLFTTTGGDGRYRLYGVSGHTALAVTRTGYTPRIQHMAVVDYQTHHFELALVHLRDDFSGTYTLTMTAAESCAARLPAEARTRTYTAALTQNGALIEAKLTAATFAVNRRGQGSGFRGRVDPDQVVFRLTAYDSYYYQYADLVEQIGESTYFIADGTAVLTGSPSRLEDTLDGVLQIFDRDPRVVGFRPVTGCQAQAHRFTLSR